MPLSRRDFFYDLPKNRIAQVPIEPRDHARLMVLQRDGEKISHRYFFDLPSLLLPSDVLVFNRSKVIPARISFDFNGKSAEVFFVRDIGDSGDDDRDGDGAVASSDLRWEVMVRPGRLFRVGAVFSLTPEVTAEVLEVKSSDEHGHRIISVRDSFKRSTFDLLHDIGSVPLPPYIQHNENNNSMYRDRYQTVYAEHPGSVAAPTAGLHFTQELLARLATQGVALEYVTLHVGPGTFLPVTTEDISQHHMHSEYFDLSGETAERLQRYKKERRRIIAVGTTSVRVLESCINEDGVITPQTGETRLFITPGYRFRFVDSLITNFHLPESTLLMLVSALTNREFVLRAYREAIEQEYRFFSFGDAMFLY